MLINLISLSNYQSYNVILAQALGLNTAVYLNALIEINEKAIRKNKLENDHFLIDRKYITERTTLGKSQQRNIEKTLEAAHIIHKKDDDYIKVNIDILSGIMMGENETIVNDLSFLKTNDKQKRTESILIAVKRHINGNYPQDMKDAYSEWLDVIQNKFGFVSKQMILDAQRVVDKEADHNVDVAIDIINIASANGWKDMRYAVQTYNKQRQVKPVEVKQNRIDVDRESF